VASEPGGSTRPAEHDGLLGRKIERVQRDGRAPAQSVQGLPAVPTKC
jgi:hypothetical protein